MPAPKLEPVMMVIAGTVEFDTALISFAPFLMIPSCSYFLPTMNPVVFCKNKSGVWLWLQSWMNCAPLFADSLKSVPLLARIPTGKPWMCAQPHTSVEP